MSFAKLSFLTKFSKLCMLNAQNVSKYFQYAGTAALKGDVTRSGQRGLTGMMKDGYNSASRYYLSHIRDQVLYLRLLMLFYI